MKKLLFIASAVLMLSGCAADEKEIQSGVYVLQTEDAAFNPYISIDAEEESFVFFFDSLSSYMNTGKYTVEDDILIAETSDGKYWYIFEITEDALIFDKDNSSSVELIDENIGEEIADRAEFKME